jgi:hypothetical protein
VSTELERRTAEIQRDADAGATYCQRLIAMSGGVENAARVDLAIDGNHWDIDMRRKPYAGNEHLKSLARAAIRAQDALRNELIAIAWHGPSE